MGSIQRRFSEFSSGKRNPNRPAGFNSPCVGVISLLLLLWLIHSRWGGHRALHQWKEQQIARGGSCGWKLELVKVPGAPRVGITLP